VRGGSERPDDRRQRRRHDHLVDRGEQHPEHQSAEDEPQPTAIEGYRTGRAGYWLGHAAASFAPVLWSSAGGASAPTNLMLDAGWVTRRHAL
jgi:hypothetical protein